MLYKKNLLAGVLFALPFLLFAAVFLFYPAIINVYNGFFKYLHVLDESPVFVRWENYKWLFDRPDFWRSLSNTGILILFVIVFQVGIALILALLVNNLKKSVPFFRIVYFMPIVVSATAIGLMYLMFIQPKGLFSEIFGTPGKNWLPEGKFLALLIIMIPVLWQYIGFYFVIFLTGLSGIPEDIIEAAKIDGASAFKSTFSIVLPMMWNVLRTTMVLAITGALKVFDMPHTIAPHGAPARETIFMGTYNNFLYSSGWIGQSAVYSIFIVLAGILVSVLSNSILRENKDIQ